MAHRDDDALGDLPSLDDAPVVWDPIRREFVPASRPVKPRPSNPHHAQNQTRSDVSPPNSSSAATAQPVDRGGRRHVVVPAPPVMPRPRPGTAPSGPPSSPQPLPRPAARPAQQRMMAPAAVQHGGVGAQQQPALTGGGGRRFTKVVMSVVLVMILLVGIILGFGWWRFSRIPRVDVAQALSTGAHSGTNYLIVGTDSREGISEGDANAGAFLGGEPSGARTDTIMVMRFEGSKTYLLSIPRDLWVVNPTTGEMGRINSTYADGPATLIAAVRDLGIPVHHYMEINFVTFGKLVDAVDGISIDFPYPARDTHSGLDIATAGTHKLDGTQALAYVRSRYYEEYVDGTWKTDPLSDLGRVERQRNFMGALFGRVTHVWNPVTLLKVGNSMGAGLKIDKEMTYFGTLALGWRLRGFNPESITLPVTPRTTSGGAAVLDLQETQAAPIVQQFSA